MNSPIALYKRDKYKFYFLLSLTVLLIVCAVSAVAFPIYYGSVETTVERTLNGLMADMGQVFYFSLVENPYTSPFPTIYLPLAVIIMKPFALIGKNNPVFYLLNDYKRESVTTDPSEGLDSKVRYIDIVNNKLLRTPEFWIATALYYALIFILIGVVLWKMRKWESKKQFFFAYFSVFMSGLVLVGILRGTNVFTCLLLLLLFYKLYNSPRAWQREIGLICLAVSGVLRLYPLLFGAILLRDKKWFAALRVAVYTVALSVLPFAFYGGIVENLQIYFHNIVTFVRGGKRMQGSMNLSVYSFFGYCFNRLNINNKTLLYVCGGAAMAAAFIASLFVALFSRSRARALLGIVLGILTVTPVSYYYVTMLLILPLVIMVDEWKTFDKPSRIIYTVLFLGLGFLPTSVMAWYIPQIIYIVFVLFFEAAHLVKDIKSRHSAVNAQFQK